MIILSIRHLRVTLALSLALAGSACTPGAKSIPYGKEAATSPSLQGETTVSGGSGASAAGATPQQIYQDEVAQLNQQLNEQQPAYALSEADVGLLQTQGLLDSQEQAQVAPLIKK